MSIENEFKFIGWNTEGTSDKIWGYFLRPTPGYDPSVPLWRRQPRNICIFWGRRGKAMQFKGDVEGSDIEKLVRSKLNKGYLRIDQTKLLSIWPTFITEAEGKLMWDVLAGRVK